MFLLLRHQAVKSLGSAVLISSGPGESEGYHKCIFNDRMQLHSSNESQPIRLFRAKNSLVIWSHSEVQDLMKTSMFDMSDKSQMKVLGSAGWDVSQLAPQGMQPPVVIVKFVLKKMSQHCSLFLWRCFKPSDCRLRLSDNSRGLPSCSPEPSYLLTGKYHLYLSNLGQYKLAEA